MFASGGYQHHATADVFAYSIEDNAWKKDFSMNTARSYHASCIVNDTIYFIGGRDSHSKRTNSIEWYNLKNRTRGSKDFTVEQFAPRELPVVACILGTKIVIMGGKSD